MSNNTLGDLFTGKLLRLGVVRNEDREHYARWSNDAEYMRLLDDEPIHPKTPEMFNFPRSEDSWGGVGFGLRTLAEDKFIGFTGLWGVNWSSRSSWFAIGIGDRDYWGKGYGTEAVDLTLGYAFRELSLNRVQLFVFAYNLRAIRAYEKVGFVREATLRQSLLRDGKRYDTYLMGILYRDWESKRAAQHNAG